MILLALYLGRDEMQQPQRRAACRHFELEVLAIAVGVDGDVASRAAKLVRLDDLARLLDGVQARLVLVLDLAPTLALG